MPFAPTVPATAPSPQGPAGNDGAPGPQGPPGADGQVGEVTTQQLTDAINSTARNPATVGAYTGDFSDPPTQTELRAFRDWCNSFFNATAR